MAFRRQKPQLTGPDYLLGVARRSADEGQPFADVFSDMVFQAFSGSPLNDVLLAGMTAQRPLREHEASPVAIILAAAEMAKANGDSAGLDEVLRVGLTLLAKWPAFLLSRVDGHPDFDWRSTNEDDR